MIQPPNNIRYDSSNKKLLWDGVPDAEEYEIIFTPAISVDWKSAYSGGNDTECSFVQPVGAYKAKGKTQKGGVWGTYGPEYSFDVI